MKSVKYAGLAGFSILQDYDRISYKTGKTYINFI